MTDFSKLGPGTYLIQSKTQALKQKFQEQKKEIVIPENKVIGSKPILDPEIVIIPRHDGKPDDFAYIFSCPGCLSTIQVLPNEIACKEFRCGDKLDPHATKEVCERAVAEGRTLGCGTAFWFDGKKVVKIGYTTPSVPPS
jgi:hypothetical protein